LYNAHIKFRFTETAGELSTYIRYFVETREVTRDKG